MMNRQQKAYAKCRVLVEVLQSQKKTIETAYINERRITNPDGTIPQAAWMIDDDEVFSAMMADVGDELDALKLPEAEKALRKAADDLIRYGLSIMPNCYDKERKALEDVCFGLNGHYVHMDKRDKMLDYTMRLDVRTVPKRA